MIDCVIARRINLRTRNRLRNVRGGRPYGKSVVAGAAGGAIVNQGIPHPDIQVVSVRDEISHPAITDDQSVGVTRPTPNFGMFYPNPGSQIRKRPASVRGTSKLLGTEGLAL
jgi:hypothetical protein